VKIKVPIIVLVLILIVLVLIITKCTKEDEYEREETGEKIATITRGEWNGNKYKNDFINIIFNLPNNWNKYSDEQIAEIMNIHVDKLSEENNKISELAQKQPLYLMIAKDSNTGAKVMIMIEAVDSEVTSEYYINALKEQLKADKTTNNEIGEEYIETISGQKFKALDVSMSSYGMEQRYYVKKQENYIVSIIITTGQTGQYKQILSNFE